MKYTLIFLLVIGVATLGLVAYFKSAAVKHSRLQIGDVIIDAELAQTVGERELGLSGRSSLANGQGMFFIFNKQGLYEFWMKDMKFPIDIIWLDESYKVIYIKENADPSSYPTSFSPPDLAQYVLEVNAGFARAHGIVVGTQAKLLE